MTTLLYYSSSYPSTVRDALSGIPIPLDVQAKSVRIVNLDLSPFVNEFYAAIDGITQRPDFVAWVNTHTPQTVPVRDELVEGTVKKGGVNPPPTTPRPEAPKAQLKSAIGPIEVHDLPDGGKDPALQGVKFTPSVWDSRIDFGKVLGLLEWGWTIIANVSSGNWSQQPVNWQDVAAKWRDEYMLLIHLPKLELPLYECHKKVRAVKLRGVEIDASRAIREDRPCRGGAWLQPDNACFPDVWVDRDWAERNRKMYDKDPGYYVEYEDGYTSWSPTAAFESGYTAVAEKLPFP